MKITFENATPHKLDFHCPSCQASLSVDMPFQAGSEINTGKISFGQPCPVCGAEISAPGGRYKAEDGKMVRVGDYTPSDEHPSE